MFWRLTFKLRGDEILYLVCSRHLTNLTESDENSERKKPDIFKVSFTSLKAYLCQKWETKRRHFINRLSAEVFSAFSAHKKRSAIALRRTQMVKLEWMSEENVKLQPFN
ncbi:hypothetical protein AVEN_115332-1 [Araneus ventricosus]|uniref:Uncharacterized protein n=1 Tax=Araneus ventricosus TaxID=182803 RepID=A0A4Y1ZYY4_ARAVE|nr:hypothetical protein AVEN_115332-1 [Araneus ventricosus]